MENRELKTLKIVLLVSSLVTLVFLMLSAFEEHLTGEWRTHQIAYRTALITRADTEPARLAAQRMEIGLQQSFLPQLDRIDRCVTCHVATLDPVMRQAEPPIRSHSGDILEHHPPDTFGCTVCHEGQGRAVDRKDAHGEVEHWEAPLLRGEAVYRSCGKCHYENDLFGSEQDLYAKAGSPEPIVEADLRSRVRGAEKIGEGKQLTLESGCLGCHTFRGRGGSLGPDISSVGDKGTHDFDFSHIEGEHTVAQWLFQHFKKPQEIAPGTLMPDMELTDEEAEQLTEYVLSLRRKTMPASHTPIPPRRSSGPASGKQLYGIFCASCHGDRGQGSTVRDPAQIGLFDRPEELMVPSLNNPDTLAVASDDYFRSIIDRGRSRTNMIAWGTSAGGGGLLPDEIDRLVDHIRGWESEAPPLESISSARGNPRYGRALYESRCRSCHGSKGEGGVGVALNSPSFLAIASDDFLARTIVRGRANTAMPSWKQLEADEVSDLLAFIRTWEHKPSNKEAVLALLVEEATPSQGSLRLGKSLYRTNCATCHGARGEGALGPSLNTSEFLSLVENGYLFDAIVEGRPGTAMPSWKHLADRDVADLIHLIRSWNSGVRRSLPRFVAQGDWERGRLLFAGSCAGCHGSHGEGAIGPQLSNPVFLASVRDATLKEWINYGKLGTPMPSFLLGTQGVTDLSGPQIEDIVTYLRRFEIDPSHVTARPGMGIVSRGTEVYAAACASCHGTTGEGLTGSALSNPDFLRIASDGFLLATIVLGRDGTEMRAMGKGGQGLVELSAPDIGNVVAFIRSWETDPPISGIPHRYVAGTDVDSDEGKVLFSQYCSGCHGVEGLDGWAPELNNPEFLQAATDGFLQATIARGRSNTAMWAFGRGAGGVVELEADAINNLVVYMRSWARKPAAAIPLSANSGEIKLSQGNKNK